LKHRRMLDHEEKDQAREPREKETLTCFENIAKRRSLREDENRLDAFAALALMRRERLSASLAAEAEGTTVKNILKYVRPALHKRGKDYVAKPSDRLARPSMTALDALGTIRVKVRGSKAASEIGRYWNAIDDALKGNPGALEEFRGRKIPHNRRTFLTDMSTLRQLQDAGMLDNLKDI
ncbi:MAG: hypothetical protein ACRDHZ_12065, partial [Ktedonobacteraceae bacterium]